MTSLCPGPLFQTSGLNQNSTPTPPTATPSEIDRKLLRQPFNGRDWPRDSPVAGVYDIGNSSTSLVLLNKRRKKRTQLRGLSHNNGEILTPEPDRHVPAATKEDPTVNGDHHKNCLNSSSLPYKPKVNLDLGWVNTTQRPPVRFDSGSHVNHRRHTSCRVSGSNPVVGWSGLPRRPMTGASLGMDMELRSMTPMLNDPDISHGGRKYLYSIARIYSTSQMKQLKQDQYHQLLFKELSKGYHSPKEYERYLSYLNTPRKTQFGKLDNYEELRRSKSAPPPADSDTAPSGRAGDTERGESRKQKRPPFSSQSWAPSMISSNSRLSSNSGRLSTRQRKGKKKGAAKSQKSAPSSKTQEEPEPKDKPQSPEPPRNKTPSEEDATDHTRKEEDETLDDALTEIKESEEGSIKSKDKKSASEEANTDQKDDSTKVYIIPGKDDDGISPRKGDESVSPGRGPTPRKGEEVGTPKKDDEVDARTSDGKDSEAAATNVGSSSNATSNNFLALIVSDAEKDDDSKTVESEQEKQSTVDETVSADPGAPRDFSDMKPARGYSPRINKEGRTRPLSRAGRVGVKSKEKENSDDDYDDTDEETETLTTDNTKNKDQGKDSQQKEEESKEEEPVQRSTLEAEPAAIDTSRTDDSKTEERGAMDEEPTAAADHDKRAGSPDEGKDERAQDSHETNGQRSLIIPVTSSSDQASTPKAEVLDLSAESKNRDVDKLEY